MPEVQKVWQYKVEIIESERGWGVKIDEVKYFDNEKDARDFNKDNPDGSAPDWYMQANYCGKV